METPNIKESYERAKQKAKEFYDSIGKIWCPALSDFVHFNRAGFDHLGWQGSRPRRKPEQMRRFAVLPYAPQILMNEPKEFEHREHPAESPATKLHGARTKALATAKFWSFAGTVDGKGVRVIVRQVGNGNKHFFSIFETGKTKQANDGQF